MTAHAILGANIPENDPLKLMQTLKAGLPASALTKFKQASGLADEQVAGLLQIGGRTLTRVRGSSARRLPADLSDRLYAIASVYMLAEQVFGSWESAIGWMNQPQFGLGNRLPLEFLSTELGRRQVRALLEQVEHGFLA